MSEGHKILVVADELSEMVKSYKRSLDHTRDNGALLNQALFGVQVSMANVMTQIRQVEHIENGNS